jgi:hypothetical protein
MKALSLTQPWAWIVLHGGKRIENRTWDTRLRGPFLIHASKGMTLEQYHSALATCRELGAPSIAARVPPPDALERGGIVGVANLSHVHSPCSPADEPRWKCPHAWHMAGQYGFALYDVKPLPFLPCKGALGFWGNFEIRHEKAVQL